MDGAECVFMFVCFAIRRLGEGARGEESEEEEEEEKKERGACLPG